MFTLLMPERNNVELLKDSEIEMVGNLRLSLLVLKELAIFETALVAIQMFINNLKHNVFGQS
jgi:hypothetical protein